MGGNKRRRSSGSNDLCQPQMTRAAAHKHDQNHPQPRPNSPQKETASLILLTWMKLSSCRQPCGDGAGITDTGQGLRMKLVQEAATWFHAIKTSYSGQITVLALPAYILSRLTSLIMPVLHEPPAIQNMSTKCSVWAMWTQTLTQCWFNVGPAS